MRYSNKMRNYTLGIVLIMTFISCSISSKEDKDANYTIQVLDTIAKTNSTKQKVVLETEIPSCSYMETLSNLKKGKLQLQVDYNAGRIKLDSVEYFFIHNLVYEIFPYWYGTPWTYEGHTNTPNDGEVACGYFVSTTLKHFGMKVNRYKMAQQAALTGLKMIAPSNCIIKYSNDSFGAAANKIHAQVKPGIYMVGFDYHVGFLYIDTAGLHFIHSNYLDPVAVVHEDAHNSPAFNNTSNVYLTKITNSYFLKKWIREDTFVVP